MNGIIHWAVASSGNIIYRRQMDGKGISIRKSIRRESLVGKMVVLNTQTNRALVGRHMTTHERDHGYPPASPRQLVIRSDVGTKPEDNSLFDQGSSCSFIFIVLSFSFA